MAFHRVGSWQNGYGPGFLVFVLGLFLGLAGAAQTGLGERTDLLNFLAGSMSVRVAAGSELPTLAILGRALGGYLFDYLAALSVIGLPLLFLQIGVRGFAVGFSLGFLWQQFGWRGLGPGILAVAAGDGLLMVSLLMFAAAGWRLAGTLLRAHFGPQPALRRRGLQQFHRLAAAALFLGLAASVLTARLGAWGMGGLSAVFR